MERIGVYSDSSFSRDAEEFVKRNFSRHLSRNWFLLKSFISSFLPPFMSRDRNVPFFISPSNACHEQDLANVKATIRQRGVKKEELSLVVFDYHTDMYRGTGCRVKRNGKEELHMSNWILHMIEEGFTDISLVGVGDFLHTDSDIDERWYGKYGGVVSYFVSDNIDLGQFENRDGLELRSMAEFKEKELRDYSFVSLDCDVSNSIAHERRNMADEFLYGPRGTVALTQIEDSLGYVGHRSDLIGVSFYCIDDLLSSSPDRLEGLLEFT